MRFYTLRKTETQVSPAALGTSQSHTINTHHQHSCRLPMSVIIRRRFENSVGRKWSCPSRARENISSKYEV